MRRASIALLAALPLAALPVAAWPAGAAASVASVAPVAAVAGTVVSVDPSSGALVADAYPLPSRSFHPDVADGGPSSTTSATRVTITTDSNTTIRLDQQIDPVGDLVAGDTFIALFNGLPGDSLATLLANPALAVFAETPPTPRQLYAFVGAVTAVDVAAGTVTLNVIRAFPSDLVPSGSGPVSFTVTPGTMVLGGSAPGGVLGGSLRGVGVGTGDIGTGDIVAGGFVGDSGLTLGQVQATPLELLLDLPPAAGSSPPSGSGSDAASTQVLNKALSLLGDRHTTSSQAHRRSHRSHGRSHRSHGRSHRSTDAWTLICPGRARTYVR